MDRWGGMVQRQRLVGVHFGYIAKYMKGHFMHDDQTTPNTEEEVTPGTEEEVTPEQMPEAAPSIDEAN